MTDAPAPSRLGRFKQLGQVFNQTRLVDPQLVPLIAGVALGIIAVFVVAGFLLDQVAVLTVLGVLLALLAALAIFTRRATATAIRALEGKPGAAAAVLGQLRRPWRVTPAVAFNRRQDLVHMAVGRPGVLLVAEGANAGAAALLKQTRARVHRVAGDAEVHEVLVGDGAGMIPLGKLQAHVMRLRPVLKPESVEALDQRLRAVKSMSTQNLPIPKGPIPRSRRAR